MSTDPQEFVGTWDRNQPDALERLRAALRSARERKGCHSAWGRLCEEAGQDSLALVEYQLALRDDPGDLRALERLALLHHERGELERALEYAERRAAAEPAGGDALEELVSLYLESDMREQAEAALARAEAAGAPPARIQSLEARVRSASRLRPMEPEEQVASALAVPGDADVVRFGHLFAGRENVYARQWWDESGDGGYTPVRQPLIFQVVKNHLLGSITVGVYPVRLDNTVTFFALDVDINKRALARARGDVREARRVKDRVSAEARRLQEALAGLGLPSILEDSGYKGRHLWVFLLEPVEASVVRQFGLLFTAAFPLQSADLHIEFFPKQAAVEGGLGNLIKLPLGVHRRTGRRSRLLAADGSEDPDPFGTLRGVERVARGRLFEVIIQLKARGVPQPAEAPPWEDKEAAPLPAVPAPPQPPAAWTAADFETQPEVSHLLRSCAVAAFLKEKVEKHRRLAHDEQVVLIHSLGHSAASVLAVNYMLDSCVDVPASARLQTPLSGNPISCPRIRKRIPGVTGQVNCNCSFDFAPDHYPTPRLHLQTMPKVTALARRPEPEWDPVERARALGVLRRRRAVIEQELLDLEKALLSFLESSGRDRIELDEGALALRHEAGAPPALEWLPKEDAAPALPPA